MRTRTRRPTPSEARRQAEWIVALEPWRSLGYTAPALGRWLGRCARRGWVWVVPSSAAGVLGIVVVQPEVLLGSFISLVAVRPEASGQGVGRALVEGAAKRVFARSRWLYTSSDGENAAAARFYRKLGFQRVGRLPGMIREGRSEIMWRRGRG
jgi:ribosomal protein S18 acetylase RimI-like enzyme